MYGTETRGKLNTGDARPVYTRELPPGRKLAGAEPGAYLRDGSFVPWEKLDPKSYNGGGMKTLLAVKYGSEGGVIVLPQDTEALSAGVFSGTCADAVVFPAGLKKIGRNAFKDARILSAVFPAGLRSIGDRAFAGSHISSAVFPEHIMHTGSFCFACTGGLEYAAAFSGDAHDGESVFSHSGISVFAGCVPAGLAAASGCRELVLADLRDGAEIPPGSFSGCTALECVALPAGLRSVGRNAFAFCASLGHTVIPDGVRELGEKAFVSCISLSSVKYRGEQCQAGENAFAGTPAEKYGTLPPQILTA